LTAPNLVLIIEEPTVDNESADVALYLFKRRAIA
jgi:hypothetical protein